MMNMQISIQDDYLDQFYNFVNSIPKDAIVISNPLDDIINDRIKEYKDNKNKTVNFSDGLERIREKIVSKI